MKLLTAIVFSVLLMTSCSSSKKTTTTNGDLSNTNAASTQATAAKQDGLTFETAIFITEKSEMIGPAAEYKWIKEHYTDYKVKGQALVYHNKKPFDIITIIFSYNKELKLYFDISNYFGKF